MLALTVTDVKEFMHHLLMADTFDEFALEEASVIREYSIVIDGSIHEGYYTEEELEIQELDQDTFLPYKRLRPLLFEQIKGKRTPLQCKFIFALSAPKAAYQIPQMEQNQNLNSISHFLLNVRYDSQGLILTTGVSYATFCMDKSLEREWDDYVKAFLRNLEICFQE